ncbi:thiol reductant ABC exporter subunit CydD [Actinomycetaceae bacterium MB13-C1-2]|nr:thiol reductant ABC exporter subunit CydD [Actinomycetaceae bacterium MB13-C1-2]
MKPLDPRLLKYARSARRYIAQIAVLGLLTAALVIAQAFLVSASLSPVVTSSKPLAEVMPTVLGLAAVVAVRALLVYLREAGAHRAADQTIAELRAQVLAKSARLGPRWRARNAAENATLVTRGLDDLDPYFVKFLPQLLLVMTATPLALVTILFLDFWSALIALLTIPLIPIFMVLIGKMTVGFSSKKLLAMERLGAQLLDLLTGLPTLRALGREKGPREHLVRLSKQNTKTTMQTLRVAFLSGGVLEFLATLSVALVAVQVGMRMVSGQLSLFVGLVIIMLAPEVFEPLRQVGAQFHASTNGVAAAEQCFTILETPERESGTVEAAGAGTSPIRIEGLSVASRGAWAPYDLNGTIAPGRITALAGVSGGGKSTTVQVLLGLEPATRGMIRAESAAGELVPVEDFSPHSWYQGISWIPQHPTISPGTVLSNVLPSTASEVNSALGRAARATGFDAVVDSLPQGWNTEIGLGGVGLSVGQRQRLALTRVLVNVPTLLVLDEPTAHLDAMNEEQIVEVLKELRSRGTTIVVIAHRQAVLRASDAVLHVESHPATEAEMKLYPQLLDDYDLEDLSGELPGFLDSSYLPEDDVQGMKLFEEQEEVPK